MTKKEILEIRKQFTPENCSLTRIVTGYVSPEKELSMFAPKAFLSLPEEEAFKYFDIFKAALSGKKGKTLYDIEYPTVNGSSDEENMIRELRDSRLTRPEITENFCEKIMDSYDCPEGYLIVLIHGAYDIPGKTADDEENFDASDEVYEHILCCICPVSLSKPGLSIKPEEKKIEDRIRDWVIGKPLNAMLYPAFNDRSEDIHSLLYFSKNVKCMQEEFVHAITGIQDEIRSGEDEKLLFGEKFTDCTNGSADYDILYAFQEKALEVLESADTDEVKISPKDLGSMLQSSGVEEEQAEAFVKSMGDVKELNLGNLVDKSKMTVTLPDATIKIPAQYAYRLEVKEIDGRMYAAFPIDENYVEVNGIAVKAR